MADIDIEKLAREAGSGRGTSGRWLMTDAELAAYTALVLEEAAKVCEEMHDEDRPPDYAWAVRHLAEGLKP